MKKQGTVVDFNNILSEEEFQDILENLKKFKNYCDQPNKLLAPRNEHLSPQTISELSGCTLISRLADGKRGCNLRKFHSFESLNKPPKKSSPRNTVSANNSIRPINRKKDTTSATVRHGTEETCVCSSFCSVSEDTDGTHQGDSFSYRNNSRNQKVLRRQYGRQSSSDTLIDLETSVTPSIQLKTPSTAPKKVRFWLSIISTGTHCLSYYELSFQLPFSKPISIYNCELKSQF